ncbi:MAG: glycoside hydrolase family 9 protein [Anaerolineaceae bacterium]|nr:glycoside hydrolase family 9 protein [Anaerolineaceae bacterium]
MTTQVNLKLTDQGFFEGPGLNILAFNNCYEGLFNDAKISGVELIHQEMRTVTNGDVRLSATPAQWDVVPQLVSRNIDTAQERVDTTLRYADYGFTYTVRVQAEGEGVRISVLLDEPLPAQLEGKAGFNLEFLPSAYFHKTYQMDGQACLFPRYPTGPMEKLPDGSATPAPFTRGKLFIAAPGDPARMVKVECLTGAMSLYDGRNAAQNGWFVLRTLLPAGQKGTVLEWLLSAGTVPGWLRKPVIAHSQVGYHPKQKKVAVIELDRNDQPQASARLLQATPEGGWKERLAGEAKPWGPYLRYDYLTFDFSAVKETGVYVIEYRDVRTAAFPISEDVYEQAWHPTLDVFFPVQMDHMFVREAYRVWHGESHKDDALQAPVNHEHFDLYAQGPTTDTPYQPGEHIPGLNIGGWYDAGDFDIRTQTQYGVVSDLVAAWEAFEIQRDETMVDQVKRYVEIHAPDGVPDVLQQIEHGTLALIAQFRSVGHAIHGIVEPTLQQYTHLGDAVTKTDNLIYNPNLKPNESDGFTSGRFDDRWAFTSKSTALNYGSIAALAAASRALRGYRDELAEECLETAVRIWEEEHSHAPDIFAHGNTTGGPLEAEELRAAVQLLLTTGQAQYKERLQALWPTVEKQFGWHAGTVAQALDRLDEDFKAKFKELVKGYRAGLDKIAGENPFGVMITTHAWAGSGFVTRMAMTNYWLHKLYPDLIDAESVYRGLHYLFGCHPGSDISFVSGVGAVSKEVAYGNNRADFTFIAGGIVPGVLIIKPDFPENKEDWPFYWGQNEYVISEGACYLFLVHAARELLKG